MQRQHPTAEQIIQILRLENHVEGGYFRRTFQSDHRPTLFTGENQRYLTTSIYYLLTQESDVGHWHNNKSDILHYFHLGDPIEYSLILPNGTLQQIVLGTDLINGQQLQFPVMGGTWKTSRLLQGEHGFGLISEAVSPGFDYADMTIADSDTLQASYPQHKELINKFAKK